MLEVRKTHIAIEETRIEGGRSMETPLTTAIVAVVLRNPWAGLGFTEDLRTEIRRFAPELGSMLAERLVSTMGSAEAIEATGKASVVGLNGELEHAAAMVHTLLFGDQIRKHTFGEGALVFSNTRAGAGALITVPMVHKDELLRRTHYHTAQTSIVDAPGPDEVIVALGAASGSRPFPRIGDRDLDRRDIEAAEGSA